MVVPQKPGEAFEKVCVALFPLIQPKTKLLKSEPHHRLRKATWDLNDTQPQGGIEVMPPPGFKLEIGRQSDPR